MTDYTELERLAREADQSHCVVLGVTTLRRLVKIAQAAEKLADSVDAWNRDVEAIIGRQPNSGIATAALREAMGEKP